MLKLSQTILKCRFAIVPERASRYFNLTLQTHLDSPLSGKISPIKTSCRKSTNATSRHTSKRERCWWCFRIRHRARNHSNSSISSSPPTSWSPTSSWNKYPPFYAGPFQGSFKRLWNRRAWNGTQSPQQITGPQAPQIMNTFIYSISLLPPTSPRHYFAWGWEIILIIN